MSSIAATTAIRRRSAMGLDYGEKGELDRAIGDYTEIIRLNPKDATAYRNRGWVYANKGEQANSDEDVAQANKLGEKVK